MDIISWNIIDKYFKENPYNLVSHHLDSYNDFFTKYIYQLFKDNNPIRFIERDSQKGERGDVRENREYRNEIFLYMGGRDGKKLYFGKPVLYDTLFDEGLSSLRETHYTHYMYPNDARLNNLTYGFTIHYDVDVEIIYYNENKEKIVQDLVLEKIYLGKFPLMLQSKLCILYGLSRESRYYAGECKNDYGGYFIIDGKEKVIVSQEKFGDNMLYIKQHKEGELYNFSCEVHSVSEDASKPIRYTSVRMVAPSVKYTNLQLVVDIPNVRKSIPLFVLMRALGIISDKQIIKYCILDLESNKDMINYFIPSIHDSQTIFTQENALRFIASFTKRQSIDGVMDILINYFLPHIGETNYTEKAYYIGFMVMKVLKAFMGVEKVTDRDNFKFKRIELSGTLIYNLFREYLILQNRNIWLKIDKEYYYHSGKYEENFISLIEDNIMLFFKDNVIEEGFKKAFKGNWGASENTKRLGVLQDLNRLSYFTFLSHLRKINLPLDPTAKIVSPHLLHSSQWGYIDPVDTPDGGNVGLHKHLALSASVTNGYSSYPLIVWIRNNSTMKLLTECETEYIYHNSKIFVNGNWIGVIDNPIEFVNNMRLFRRNGIIPIYTSIAFNYKENIIYIYCDSGRLIRPLYYRNMKIQKIQDKITKIYYESISYDRKELKEKLQNNEFTWTEITTGFNKKDIANFNYKNNVLYDPNILYPQFKSFQALIENFKNNQSILDFIDCSEEENCFISNTYENSENNNYYTNVELEPSLIFGVMGNSIIYPEHNQLPRNVFSCGQSRQAVSLNNTNHNIRYDKTNIVLNYGQTPLIKSRYLDYITREEMTYGVNTIVAIASYNGYNVEDAILINKGSIDRGLFRTTYYTTYESFEESSKVSGTMINSSFSNIEKRVNISNLSPGYDYSQLDENGIIKIDTPINEKVVLIGNVKYATNNSGEVVDNSTFTKKGQLGYVDKVFMTEGEEGFRIAKVRIIEDRTPAIGDKFASRAGQKGTIGLILPEEDMPYNSQGLRPDIIINPHALPSRMTIGQLIECLFSKLCVNLGFFGDCTVFANKGSNYETYGKLLSNYGFHNSGNEILYNGYTGEQLYSDIFIGPTYYMRLKHMVKDKINHRATGKRNILTRQVNQGRSNDGGLRIGEMERDGIMANGMSKFLNESFMLRGDKYYLAICNQSGCIAIYNKSKNIFLSPYVDGPLKFSTNIDGKDLIKNISIYGRDFSIVEVPYAFKLLMQELQVMNVQMRIITEDNVDQINNLNFKSRNINKLLNIENNEEIEINEEIYKIINEYKLKMDEKLNFINSNIDKSKDIFYSTKISTSETLLSSQETQPSQPSEQSIPYAPYSPAFQPSSQEIQQSPPSGEQEQGIKITEQFNKLSNDSQIVGLKKAFQNETEKLDKLLNDEQANEEKLTPNNDNSNDQITINIDTPTQKGQEDIKIDIQNNDDSKDENIKMIKIMP